LGRKGFITKKERRPTTLNKTTKGIHYEKGAKANNAQERGKDRAAKGEGGKGETGK
jgi:hypothetical protein